MREAILDGQVVRAGPRSPSTACCPRCGSTVHKRKRRDGEQVTYFYRHQPGTGDGCPLRYTPGEKSGSGHKARCYDVNNVA